LFDVWCFVLNYGFFYVFSKGLVFIQMIAIDFGKQD